MNLPIIAADGAANHLDKMGVTPSIITGDLDSVKPAILKQFPFLHLPDQSQSDYQKTMFYLRQKQLLPAIILGINGGYLDHVLNNINIFMDTDCLLYSPPIRGFVIKEQSKASLNLQENTKISLIGLPNAVCSSKGLKWDLKQVSLSFPGKTSCFNRCQQSDIELETHSGAVLVLIYDIIIHDAGL
jgi:thiamine pyrophosphokinase